jgi:hypothetical protein
MAPFEVTVLSVTLNAAGIVPWAKSNGTNEPSSQNEISLQHETKPRANG